MDVHKAKDVISILMGSSLYLSLQLEERRSLLERLEESYPQLFTGSGISDEEETTGY